MGPVTRYREAVATNTWTSTTFRDKFRLLHMHVTLTADATAGNRQVGFEILQAGNSEWDAICVANATASATWHHSFMPGVYRETSFSGNDIQIPFPQDLILLPGDTLRVYDTADVSSSDTMVITYRLEEV